MDIGFVEGPDLPGGLDGCPVGHDELVLVVAPEHPWARRRRAVTARELGTTALVCREPGSGTRYTLDSKLAGIADRAGPSVEFSSTTAIKAAVEAGLGPSVLSSLAVAGDLALLATTALPGYAHGRSGDWNGLQSYVDTLDSLADGFAQAEARRLPDDDPIPTYVFTPSAHDDSLASPGHHTVYLACPTALFRVRGGWDAVKEELTERLHSGLGYKTPHEVYTEHLNRQFAA